MAKLPKKKSISTTHKASNSWLRWYLIGGLVLLMAVAYFLAFANNLAVRSKSYFLLVPPNCTSSAFIDSLEQQDVLKYTFSFQLVAKTLNFEVPKPGLYRLENGWGNLRLIAHLQNTIPKPHTILQVKPYRNRANTLRFICKQTGEHINVFSKVLQDSIFLNSLGVDKESVYCLFYPGQLNVYQKATPQEIIEALEARFIHYWSTERLDKTDRLGLEPTEVTVLATIVYAETKQITEMPLIAGVYLNRLEEDMRLESDPTLVFAKGDFTMQRVYYKDMESNSPYNTYRRKGLPPGPIGEINYAALDAVLNYTEHDFLFFCAHSDLSGTHVFSQEYESHVSNAIKYREALNKKKIK